MRRARAFLRGLRSGLAVRRPSFVPHDDWQWEWLGETLGCALLATLAVGLVGTVLLWWTL